MSTIMKSEETVESLRKKNYKVRVFHFRNCADIPKYANHNPKGGRTEVQVESPDGIVVVGEAKCSKKENYCKKVGVKIALGRAMKRLEAERNPFEMNGKQVSDFLDQFKEAQRARIERERPVLDFLRREGFLEY